MAKRMHWKRGVYVPRGPGTPRNLQWSDVSGQWVFAGVTATTTSVLIQLQSPSNLSSLTADPPEDLSILRIVGTFLVQLNAAVCAWTLALLVADVTWTPGGSVATDNDKRILWHQQYENSSGIESLNWARPNYLESVVGGAVTRRGECDWRCTHIDIKPRVVIEDGKALYLVAYEETNGGTLTVVSQDMRVLYKRRGRR